MIKTHLPILMACSGNLQAISIALKEEGATDEEIQKIEDAREVINSYINPGL